MNLYISMIRDYLKKKEQVVSVLNGPNSLFQSFRLTLPEQQDKEMLYLQPEGSTIRFICGQGSFISYNLSVQMAVALTLEACQYYDHWEKSLREAVWDTPDYQALIDLSEKVFENPMLITNWQGKVLGYSSAYKHIPIREFWTQLTETGALPISCLQNLRESAYFHILKEENKVNLLHFDKFDYTCLLGLVHEKHEILLHFQIIEYNRKITETDLLLANTFLDVLRRVHHEIKPSYHESATYIFSQLLSGEPVDDKLLKWVLSALSWSAPDTLFYLICFQVMDQKGNAKSMLLQLERSIPGSKMLIHEDLPIMLLSMPLLERFKNDLLYINNRCHLKCCISMPFNDWSNLSVYYSQASSLLHITGNNTQLHFCRDYVFHFLKEDIKKSVIFKHIQHPAVMILEKYDSDNDTELVTTLYSYLLNERSSALTAKKLHIHRNTLQYRILRIRELVDLDFEDPETRLHLLLTCMTRED